MTRAVVAGLDARAGLFPIRLTEGDALPFTIEFLEADGATPTPLAAGTYVLEVRPAPGAAVTHTVALTRGGTSNHELTGTFSAVLTAAIGSTRQGVHAIVNTTTSSTLLAGPLEIVPRGEAGAGWPDNLARVVGLPGPAGDPGILDALTTVVAGKLAKASNLSDLADIPTARTNLGLGSAATTAASAYDAAGTAAAAQAAAIAAAATDATAKANAKVADAINDGVTTVAPSQNAVFDALAPKAPLASPALTGNPTAPTQAQGNNTTRIATTEFVHTEASLLVPKALVDAKGDLLVATAPDTVARLPVGTDGQVLVADSAQTPGVKWASATAGITNGMPRVSGDTVRAFTVPGVIVQGLGTVTPSKNRTVFQPIRLDRQRTFDQVQIEVTAAAVSGARCRTAIYAVDDYWQATDLLFDSGQMANDAIAVVTAGISLTLPAGNYMMVTVSQGSATFRVTNCLPPWLNAFKAAAGASGYLNVFTAGSNANVADGFPAVADGTVKFEGATGTSQVTISYYARLREAA